MIDRLERLPRPEPDVGNLLAVLRRQRPRRVPLIELKLDDEVMSALLGEPFIPWSPNAPVEARRRFIRQTIDLMHRLGFDAFRLRTHIPFRPFRARARDTAGLSRGQREWQDEHRGPIQSLQDLERYPWPTLPDVDFGPVEEILRTLPEGMAGIGYTSGVFEWSSWLMGLETFMLAIHDQPELVRALIERVALLLYQCLEVWCRNEDIPILWIGDDWGFKTGTLIHPDQLRQYILPWYQRFVDLAHRHGKLFILHSCGDLHAVMPDLAETVRIDAKHSFEDVIEPVEAFVDQWGGKVAALGGVDVDILARQDEEAIVRRTRQILEHCAPRGGYAAGSGNSVANYIPPDHYLAMVETVHRFNGRL